MHLGLKRFVISRILFAIPMTLLLLTAIFVVMHILPGDPVEALYGEKLTQESIDIMRHNLGLDRPLQTQYADFMIGLFRGDLGTSIWSHRSVVDELLYAYPATLELTILAMLLSTIVGFALGIAGAMKKDKIQDYLIRIFSLIGYSLPVFFIAQLLQYSLGVQLGLFPIQGRYSARLQYSHITGFATIDTLLNGNVSGFANVLAHLFLPALALTFYVSALINRVTRANMIETLGEDYLLMARAKGLRESEVIYKHAFRNALLPVFTVVGLYFASLLGGAILTETVFSLPGIGRLLMDSVFRRDYPVIQGCVVVYALSVVVVTTVVDVLYAFLDPRIRY